MGIEILSEQRCFGGTQGFYRHASSATGGEMRFGVYRPPLAQGVRAPVLYYLAGLTCNEETFAIKAGAQRLAAELGIVLVTPDTSPRATGIEGATGDWEFGEGAGFYLDATTPAYAARFRMHAYVTDELPDLVGRQFDAADTTRQGIFGHSMGGHGALVIALRHPQRYRSVSAFAPIVAPSQVPWGRKALPRSLEMAAKRREAEAERAGLPAPRPRSGEVRHRCREVLVSLGLPVDARAEMLTPPQHLALAERIVADG